MTDKGFEVHDMALPGVEVIIPPKISSKGQMSDANLYNTINVAESRIVIEMMNEQAKNYRILQVPFSISRITTAEQIIFNCFAFTNLLPPLIVPTTGPEASIDLSIYKDI